MAPKDVIPFQAYSDSESALKLLQNQDLPGRSRHVEIKNSWLREKIGRGLVTLSLGYLRGKIICADLSNQIYLFETK